MIESPRQPLTQFHMEGGFLDLDRAGVDTLEIVHAFHTFYTFARIRLVGADMVCILQRQTIFTFFFSSRSMGIESERRQRGSFFLLLLLEPQHGVMKREGRYQNDIGFGFGDRATRERLLYCFSMTF